MLVVLIFPVLSIRVCRARHICVVNERCLKRRAQENNDRRRYEAALKKSGVVSRMLPL